MGAWSVASGMMLRDWFRKDEIEEERVKYADELEEAESIILDNPILLGYLAKIDRAGYLRASGRARQTFKALNPKDKYMGILKFVKEDKSFYPNLDYVIVVEDYYFEMKRGLSREKYQMDKYRAMREWLVKGVTDRSIFEGVKKDRKYEEKVRDFTEKALNPNNIATFDLTTNKMAFSSYDEYVEGVANGRLFLSFPIRG